MSRVIGRDRVRKMCLVEGVGFARVGRMWYDATNPHFQAKEGFDDAPEMDCRGGFGSPFPADLSDDADTSHIERDWWAREAAGQNYPPGYKELLDRFRKN